VLCSHGNPKKLDVVAAIMTADRTIVFNLVNNNHLLNSKSQFKNLNSYTYFPLSKSPFLWITSTPFSTLV